MLLFRRRRRPIEGVYLDSKPLGIPIAEPVAYKTEKTRFVMMTDNEKYVTFLLFEYWCNKKNTYNESKPLPTYRIKHGKMEKVENKVFDETACVVGRKIQII